MKTCLKVLKLTQKHCYKYDEGCFVCWMRPDGLIYQLTGEEITVHRAILSGVEGELTEGLSKRVWICDKHLEQCKLEPNIQVTQEVE